MIISSTTDYRAAAQKRLPPFLFHYIDGGAYAEKTLERNVGDLADALPQEVSDASRRLADNIRHAQLERLTEKERHQGLTDEEKRRLLELLRMSAGPSRS